MISHTKYLIILLWEILAACIFLFGFWQHDLITAGPVWTTGWCHPIGRYADDYFQCGPWKTTVGEAYDTTFALAFIAFWMAIIGLAILSVSQHKTIKKLILNTQRSV